MSSEPRALKDVVIDAYVAQGDGAGGDNHWSWNVVQELLGAPPDVLWPILLELIARAPDRQLGHIAAGPVEDFISRFGGRVIEAVEKAANTGKIGDGKIFVFDLLQVVRIRTGETGSDAL